MKKFQILGGFAASAMLLTACGELPEYAETTPLTTGTTTNFNLDTALADIPTAVVKDLAGGSTGSGAALAGIAAQVAQSAITSSVGSALSLPAENLATPAYAAYNSQAETLAAQQYAMAQAASLYGRQAGYMQNVGVGGYQATPMAVHANVAGSYGGPLNFNGINGVRPFVVNTGSVWTGPSTYMLPIGTGNYVHQHTQVAAPLYTKATTYAEPITYTEYAEPVRSTVIESVKVASVEKTATATMNTFMRKGPSFDAEKCNILPKGHTAKLHYCEGRWCKITHGGETGWSARKNLRM